MIRRPPRSTPFPTRRSSDLSSAAAPRVSDRRFRVVVLVLVAVVPRIVVLVAGEIDTVEDDGRVARPSSSTVSIDRKSTRLNSSHLVISYAVFCLKKKKKINM